MIGGGVNELTGEVDGRARGAWQECVCVYIDGVEVVFVLKLMARGRGNARRVCVRAEGECSRWH